MPAGRFQPGIIALATQIRSLERLKIRVSPTGEIVKLALYHSDAAQIPEPVHALVRSKFPRAKIKHHQNEFYAGRGRVFEVELTTADKKECEVAALADGKLLYVECKIKKDKLPAPVKEAVAKLLPGGEIVDVEKKEGDAAELTVEVKHDGATHYLRLGPKGDVIERGVRVRAFLDVTFEFNAAPPPDDAIPGRLDAEMMNLIAKAKGVDKMKIRTDPAGDVTKISIYHRDEALIPEPVRTAAAAHFAGSKVEYYETELYPDRGRVFEVEVTTAEKKRCEYAAAADGKVLYVECQMKKEDLPAPILAAVLKTVPGGNIVEVEKKEPANDYSFEVMSGGVLHYLKVDAKGDVFWQGVRIPASLDVMIP